MALIHWLGSLVEPSVAAWIIIMGVIFLALWHLARLEWEILKAKDSTTESTEYTEKNTLTEYQRGKKSGKKAGI